jgi:hypothetical protein
MQTPTQSQTAPSGHAVQHRTADRVYQTLTVAAMVLLLVSLWVF